MMNNLCILANGPFSRGKASPKVRKEFYTGNVTSRLNGSFPLEVRLNPKESWNSVEVTASFEESYKSSALDAQSHKPSDTYFVNGIVFSTYQWWQSWFTNNTSALENLKDFAGPLNITMAKSTLRRRP